MDETFSDYFPKRTLDWLVDHPRVLRGACIAIFAFAACNMYQAAALVVRANELVSEAQIAASEALGG